MEDHEINQLKLSIKHKFKENAIRKKALFKKEMMKRRKMVQEQEERLK